MEPIQITEGKYPVYVTNVDKQVVSPKMARLAVTFNDGLVIQYRQVTKDNKVNVFGPQNTYQKTVNTVVDGVTKKIGVTTADGKPVMNSWPDAEFDSKTANRKLIDFLIHQ